VGLQESRDQALVEVAGLSEGRGVRGGGLLKGVRFFFKKKRKKAQRARREKKGDCKSDVESPLSPPLSSSSAFLLLTLSLSRSSRASASLCRCAANSLYHPRCHSCQKSLDDSLAARNRSFSSSPLLPSRLLFLPPGAATAAAALRERRSRLSATADGDQGEEEGAGAGAEERATSSPVDIWLPLVKKKRKNFFASLFSSTPITPLSFPNSTPPRSPVPIKLERPWYVPPARCPQEASAAESERRASSKEQLGERRDKEREGKPLLPFSSLSPPLLLPWPSSFSSLLPRDPSARLARAASNRDRRHKLTRNADERGLIEAIKRRPAAASGRRIAPSVL